MILSKKYLCKHKETGIVFEEYSVNTSEIYANGVLKNCELKVEGVTKEGKFEIIEGSKEDFEFTYKVTDVLNEF